MVELQPVDTVEITLVVDNFDDVLLAGAEGVRRFPLAYDAFDGSQLVAEHGFSALVTVSSGGRRSSVLGPSCTCPRPAGATWRPRASRWSRSAAPPCWSTARC